jgi:hypothetical protein
VAGYLEPQHFDDVVVLDEHVLRTEGAVEQPKSVSRLECPGYLNGQI